MTGVEQTAIVEAATAGDQAAFTELVRRHRRELQVHCYRMLGSFVESEDLLQETLLRAWSRRASYEGRFTFRAWLYRIATNACLDALRHKAPRVLAHDVVPAADPNAAPPAASGDHAWLKPYPDHLLEGIASFEDDPDTVVIDRETMELAFLAAIQHLPPRQRCGTDPARRARLAGSRHRRHPRAIRRRGQERAAAGPRRAAGRGRPGRRDCRLQHLGGAGPVRAAAVPVTDSFPRVASSQQVSRFTRRRPRARGGRDERDRKHRRDAGPEPNEALRALDVLVGTWELVGHESATDADIRGRLSFAWMDGGFYLTQQVDMDHGGHQTRGTEYIGFDAEASNLHSYFFGNDGPGPFGGVCLEYVYEITDEEITIWGGFVGSPAAFRGRFGDDRTSYTDAWEWPGGGYEATATKVE